MKNYKLILKIFKSVKLDSYLKFTENSKEQNYIDYRALQERLFQAFNRIKIHTAYQLNRDLDVLYIIFDDFILIITNNPTFRLIQKKYSKSHLLLPEGFENFHINIRFLAITCEAFFGSFSEQINRMYDKKNVNFETISYQTPTLHTPFIIFTKDKYKKNKIFGYLKRINSRFLVIEGINMYYEAFRKTRIKSALPKRGVLGNIIFEKDGLYYSVFSHLSGNRISNISLLNDKILEDVLNEARKIWKINAGNFISKSINDYIYWEIQIIKNNLKNLSKIKNPGLKTTAEAIIFKLLYYFDNECKKMYDSLPNHLLHGDLHIGNIRIANKKFFGFIDQRPMIGKRIIDILKLSIIRNDPSSNEWYFSEEIFRKSIRFLNSSNKEAYPYNKFSQEEIKLLTVFFRIHFLTDMVLKVNMEDTEIKRLFKILQGIENKYPIEASKEKIFYSIF